MNLISPETARDLKKIPQESRVMLGHLGPDAPSVRFACFTFDDFALAAGVVAASHCHDMGILKCVSEPH